LQRQLDDNYERISEFENATIRIELDIDRLELSFAKDQKRIKLEHKQLISNAGVSKGDLTETIRRMKHIGDARQDKVDCINKLKSDIEQSNINHLQASLEADRIHVREKIETHAEGIFMARVKRRDIVKHKNKYLETKAVETLKSGSILGSKLSMQSKNVEKLLLRCDKAIYDKGKLTRNLELIDDTGKAMAKKVNIINNKLNNLYSILNTELQLEEMKKISNLNLNEKYNDNDNEEKDVSIEEDNNDNSSQYDNFTISMLEEEFKQERILFNKNKQKLNQLFLNFEQIEQLCNSSISKLVTCLPPFSSSPSQQQNQNVNSHKKSNSSGSGGGSGDRVNDNEVKDKENAIKKELKENLMEEKEKNEGKEKEEDDKKKKRKKWNPKIDPFPSSLIELKELDSDSDSLKELLRFLLSKLHEFRNSIRFLNKPKQVQEEVQEEGGEGGHYFGSKVNASPPLFDHTKRINTLSLPPIPTSS